MPNWVAHEAIWNARVMSLTNARTSFISPHIEPEESRTRIKSSFEAHPCSWAGSGAKGGISGAGGSGCGGGERAGGGGEGEGGGGLAPHHVGGGGEGDGGGGIK